MEQYIWRKVLDMCFILLFIFMFSAPSLFAHRVNIFCYWDNNTLMCEGYFSDGREAKNSKVEIYDGKSGELLKTIFTDENGKCSLALDKKKDLKIVLLVGMGHRAECRIRGLQEEAEEPKEKIFIKHSEETITPQKIEEIVDKRLSLLEERIISLEKRLSRPSLVSVLGGIGYIIGIFSLLYLLRNKDAS